MSDVPIPEPPALPGLLPITRIDQVALVVRDLERTVHDYWARLGIGPWSIVTFGPDSVRELYYRGERASYRMRCAFAMTENVQLEIIQSLDGPNIYEEFLAAHGEGMHHVGIRVPDVHTAVVAMEERGYSVLQAGYGTGMSGDGGFAYLDTDGLLGTLIEFIELPMQRAAQAIAYPPEP
ncbi:MAG: VOC family protein [Chloroflexi bacterium]|nr:VOC family protein [Chloroflexota bacterium]